MVGEGGKEGRCEEDEGASRWGSSVSESVSVSASGATVADAVVRGSTDERGRGGSP